MPATDNQIKALLSTLVTEDKAGKLIRLSNPFPEQKVILASLLQHQKTLIVKSRQLGGTTTVSAYAFARMVLDKELIKVGHMSHDIDSASRALRFYKTFHSNLHNAPEMIYSNAKEVLLERQGGISMAKIWTAGGSGSGRSYTNQILILDEIGLYPGPAQDRLGAIQGTLDETVETNRLIGLSTPDGPGNAFHDLVQTATRTGEWNVLFFPWWQHPHYATEPPPEWKVDDQYLQSLGDKYHLSRAQLYWAWRKLQGTKLSRFRREYPSDIEEGFLSGDETFFDNVVFRPLPIASGVERVYEAPKPGNRYAAGADPSGGVGKDYAALVIVDRAGRPVYVYANNQIKPREFADHVASVCQRYNNADLIVESNNHGHAVLLKLEDWRYPRLWKDDGRYWITTNRSKYLAHDYARSTLPYIDLRDSQLSEQLASCRESKGVIFYPITQHDDLAMAYVLALQAAKTLPVTVERQPAIPSMFSRQESIFSP